MRLTLQFTKASSEQSGVVSQRVEQKAKTNKNFECTLRIPENYY